MIAGFRDKVNKYLKNSGRSQTWLREKLPYYMAASTMSQKLAGIRSFTEKDQKAIQLIMNRFK